MKRIVFLLTVAVAPVFGEGPIYQHKDSILQQEIENIYKDIRNVPNGIFLTSSITLNGVTADSGTFRSLLFTYSTGTNLTLTNLNVTNLSATSLTGISVGKVLQFKECTTSTSFATTSTSFVDTNLSCSITPTVVTSSIVIQACGTLENSNGNNNAYATLSRGGSNMMGSDGQQIGGYNQNAQFRTPACLNKMDFENTVSSKTYVVRVRGSAGTTTFGDSSNNTQVMHLWEIGR